MAEQAALVMRSHVSAGSRLLAFLAYLLGPIGWVIAFLFGRKDRFVAFHLRQSIGVFAALAIGVLAWAVVGGLIMIVPYFGPLLAAALFALVIALTAACIVLWVMGMFNALRGQAKVLPLVGARAEKWLGGEVTKPRPIGESFTVAAYANLMEQQKEG